MLARDDAMHLLFEYGGSAPWTAHCLAVADAAARVGSLLRPERGIDVARLWSSALLHDIGRHVTHHPVLHGVEGYRLLDGLGHRYEAAICASHVLFGLNAEEAARFGLPEQDFFPRTAEERLVPLVDLLLEGDRPTTLADRFSSLRERNAGNVFFADRLDRAFGSASSFIGDLEGEIGASVEGIVAGEPWPGSHAHPLAPAHRRPHAFDAARRSGAMREDSGTTARLDPSRSRVSAGRAGGRTMRVLFVCVENANRSQMAEAFARVHGRGVIEPASAGSHPSGHVSERAVEAMREVGYDLSGHSPKSLAEVGPGPWDYVITMGCGDECPSVAAAHREDWALPDPREMPPDEFDRVRDEIEWRVLELVARVRG